jgi:Tfp pilus assembly protein PilO
MIPGNGLCCRGWRPFALFLAIVVGGWWFDWSDQLTMLETREREEQTLKEDWLSKKRQAVNLAEYRRQLSEIDRQFGALLKQLPNRSEIESLLADINQAGLGRGSSSSCSSRAPKAPRTSTPSCRLPFV